MTLYLVSLPPASVVRREGHVLTRVCVPLHKGVPTFQFMGRGYLPWQGAETTLVGYIPWWVGGGVATLDRRSTPIQGRSPPTSIGTLSHGRYPLVRVVPPSHDRYLPPPTRVGPPQQA